MSKHGDLDKPTNFPFASYDIFGYLIPGATSILGILNFEHWYNRIVPDKALTPVLSTLLGPAQTIKENETVYAIALAAALLCVVYVSGHIVSSVSSFFLDRIYVAKAQGYPYETLLFLPRTSGPGFRRPDSKGFYQGAFFWINLYLVLRFASFFHSSTWLKPTLYAIEIVIALAVAAKIVASIVRGLPRLATWFSRPGIRRWPVTVAKFFLATLFPLPFKVLSRSVEGHVRTGRPFEPGMRDRYLQFFADRFGLDPTQAGSDNFWLCKMFVAHESPVFNRNLSYWLDMYTYARNLATAFYIAFIYSFVFVYLQYAHSPRIKPSDVFVLFSMPLGYFLLAGILAVRFRYIYVGYYNRFLYRSFVFLCGTQEN